VVAPSIHPCEHTEGCSDTVTTACLGCWRYLCEPHRGPGHICPPCAEKLTCCGCEGAGCVTCALPRPPAEGEAA
jgi:hypothetical protein